MQTLPDGLNTLISENGKNLSGGQRQRIGIARLVLRRYDLIIADEITASLDPETSQQVMQNLLSLPCIVVAITHDVSGAFMKRFDMLHVTAPKLHAVIRSIYEEGLLPMSEVQQKQETSKGIWQTMYGFPMVVALCFRIGSYGAVRFRDTIMKKLYGAKEKSSVIVLQFSGGTTAFS